MKVDIEIREGAFCNGIKRGDNCPFLQIVIDSWGYEESHYYCSLLSKDLTLKAEMLPDNIAKHEDCPSMNIHVAPAVVVIVDRPEKCKDCYMCPRFPVGLELAGAYHDTAPDKLILASELCEWHKRNGNEGLVYLIKSTKV